MGAPVIPLSKKVLRGTYRRDRATEEAQKIFGMKHQPITTPEGITGGEKVLFEHYATELHESFLTSALDGHALLQLVRSQLRLEQITQELGEEFVVEEETQAGVRVKLNPLYTALKAEMGIYRELCAAFGMDPRSRRGLARDMAARQEAEDAHGVGDSEDEFGSF